MVSHVTEQQRRYLLGLLARPECVGAGHALLQVAQRPPVLLLVCASLLQLLAQCLALTLQLVSPPLQVQASRPLPQQQLLQPVVTVDGVRATVLLPPSPVL